MTLTDLAARIEGLTGPDQHVDQIIWIVTDPRNGGGVFCDVFLPERDSVPIPAYTASLDAAMTLVPEGCSWTIQRNRNALATFASCGPNTDAYAATPALALCAAALRAQEASND